MRLLAAVPVVAGAAVFAGAAAAAGPVPVPPVPTPTVPVSVPSPPTVPTVPLPAVPKLPTPVAPEPVKSVSNTSAPVAGVTSSLPARSGLSSAGGSSSGSSFAASGPPSSSPSSSSSPSPSGDGTRADHFHSSRAWIGTSGSKRRRTTTLTFVLRQAGPVVLTVNELSPACAGVGRFTVAGHKGLNRVRFAGVVNGVQLAPGTYRIAIRTAGGTVVRRVTIVVIGGSAPTTEELHALKRANTCRGDGATAAAYATSRTASGSSPSASGGSDSGAAATMPVQQLQQPKTAAAGLGAPQAPSLHSGVLATSVEKTARAIQPLLVVLLALSILLLGVASLPRQAVPAGPRVHDALVRHRIALAALGAAALVAVAVAFLVT